MKTTYAELKKFVGLASAYLSTQPLENKLTYALRRTLRRIETAVQPIELSIGDRKIELASVDEKKNLIFDARGSHCFTKENYLALTQFIRDLDGREIAYEAFTVPPEEVPADLQALFREVFADGGVLPAGSAGGSPASSEKSARELELEALLRSACCIAERKGADTSWERFIESLNKLGISGVTARTYRVLPSDLEPAGEPPALPA